MSPALDATAQQDVAVPAEPRLHFLVGQDHLGRWVAVETHGLGGGLFRSRHDALHYAGDQTRGLAHAVDLSAEQIEFRV